MTMTLSTSKLNIQDKSIQLVGISSPSNPQTGNVYLFADDDNNDAITLRKSNGTEVNLETVGSGGADNLGNHTATTTLNMNSNRITLKNGLIIGSRIRSILILPRCSKSRV